MGTDKRAKSFIFDGQETNLDPFDERSRHVVIKRIRFDRRCSFDEMAFHYMARQEENSIVAGIFVTSTHDEFAMFKINERRRCTSRINKWYRKLKFHSRFEQSVSEIRATNLKESFI